jgi:hypothetical protein
MVSRNKLLYPFLNLGLCGLITRTKKIGVVINLFIVNVSTNLLSPVIFIGKKTTYVVFKEFS